MSKYLVSIVIGLVVIGVSAFTAFPQSVSAPVQAPVTQPVTTPSTPTSAGYSLQQVQSHKDSTNCWTVINGQVYDLTNWISQHPGGDRAILSICGKDGSGAFNQQHGGQNGPEHILSNFIIGPLNP